MWIQGVLVSSADLLVTFGSNEIRATPERRSGIAHGKKARPDKDVPFSKFHSAYSFEHDHCTTDRFT